MTERPNGSVASRLKYGLNRDRGGQKNGRSYTAEVLWERMPGRHLFIAAAQCDSQTRNKKQSVAFFAAREWWLTGLPPLQSADMVAAF
jgi:hypothetical protein